VARRGWNLTHLPKEELEVVDKHLAGFNYREWSLHMFIDISETPQKFMPHVWCLFEERSKRTQRNRMHASLGIYFWWIFSLLNFFLTLNFFIKTKINKLRRRWKKKFHHISMIGDGKFQSKRREFFKTFSEIFFA
jgi:hypothetical protein